MKTFITWLYREFVFMPKLRSLKHPHLQYRFLVQHDIDLCTDAEILRAVLKFSEDGGLRLVN